MDRKNDAVSIMSRVPQAELLAIENWRRLQPRIPTLSRAIRILIQLGLAADKQEAK